MESEFDPGAFYAFDLQRGSVQARDCGRVLLLSDTAAADLVASAARNGDLIPVRKLGQELGAAVGRSLGTPAADCAPEQVMGRAAAVLALYGWGRLRVERWGDAMVAKVTDAPALDEHRLAMGALLGGMMSELGGREVACVPASEPAAFIIVDASVAEQVWQWAREGHGLGAVVDRLASGGAS